MAPSLKLTYFDIKGRAEAIRLALTIGDVPFEDERLTRDQWVGPNGKEAMPLGQIPVLTVDGKVYPQSIAILRYVGKLAGLAPEDPLDQLMVDSCLETVEEATREVIASMREPDKDKKLAMRKKLVAETFPKYFGALSKMITAHGSAPGYAVGSKLTIADLQISEVVDWIASGHLDDVPKDTMEQYPVLTAIAKQVSSNLTVIAYYANKK
eukprot:TRINITY_DN29558_c0_g1_i1.p1 TRINITY_DN29558_c0_g1~~TRINITY_DN29558_c0_g1_i1.p1  ORF type:complete len:210 (+),score=51.31 TRINITY_DN29558_c0_g1_i1:310-939(+)